jgi:hypothetical protein
MKFIKTNIRWIMLTSGFLTSTMLYMAFAPSAALVSMFGYSIDGPLAEIIVRNWAALIAIVGAMLIYGAYSPANRPLALIVSGLSKLIFIGLVLKYHHHALSHSISLVLMVDMFMIVLFSVYLIGQFKKSSRDLEVI